MWVNRARRYGATRWSLPVERGCEFDPVDLPGFGLTAVREGGAANPWPECSFFYGHSAAPLYANGLIEDKREDSPFARRLTELFAGKTDQEFLQYGRSWRDRLPGYFDLIANPKIIDAS